MPHPNSIPGLLARLFRLRFSSLGPAGKLLLVTGLVGLGVAIGSLGTCLFGSCPMSGAPCDSGAAPCARAGDDSPCAGGDTDAPCPYAAAAQHAEDGEGDDEAGEDPPPCHR